MHSNFPVLRAANDDATALSLLEYTSPTAAVIARPAPIGERLTVWTIAASVTAAIAIACVAPADRVVTVHGKVASRTPPIVVQPLDTAVLRALPVHEGELVHAGTLLARLDPSFAAADAASDEAQVASLQAEVDRLEAESQGRGYVSDGSPASTLQALVFAQRRAGLTAQMESYRQRIEGTRAKLAQTQSDMTAYAQQYRAAAAKEEIRRELERLQVGSKLNLIDAGAARAEAERNLAGATASNHAAQSELDGAGAERDAALQQFRTDTSQQLTQQTRRLAEARAAFEKSQRRRALVELRADRDAVVLTVARIAPGAVAQSGEELVTLVPTDAPLEVEANVPGRDAGYVETGADVEIKFDTFPYAAHGDAAGHVTSVSADSFDANANGGGSRAAARPGGAEAGGAVYRTHISLDQLRLHDLPSGFRLTPGMPVTADIAAGRRTLMEYLLARVVPVLKEGMREP
jgi:HlyD family secretion protein